MRTGFYDLSKLTKNQLKKFYKDAILLSYDSHVDILDCSISWTRQGCKDKTLQDMLDIVSTLNHNTCIDRTIQHSYSDTVGEVGFCTLKHPDYFLYCFLDRENFNKLIFKYDLKEKTI
jgi:hypothetical protein